VLDEAQTRALHDEGIQFVTSVVARAMLPADSRVVSLIRFRRAQVAWAQIDGDSYRAVESSQGVEAWMVALPAAHRLTAQNPATFMADGKFLLIKPAPMTPEWSGLAQIHEMSHLVDAVTGAEEAGRRGYALGELRAWRSELAIADAISEGAYRRALPDAARALGVSDLEQLVELVSKHGDRLDAVTARLDRSITSAPAQSVGERGMRDGLHINAIALDIADRTYADAAERDDWCARAVLAILAALNPNVIPPDRPPPPG
jgi:hypothetical protein